LPYVIQQVWKKDGKRELGAFFPNDDDDWPTRMQDVKEPFATLHEAREVIEKYLHDLPPNDDVEWEIVNTFTGIRYSEKGDK
jgi:hypothetical protein